jgi:hypothetical protein
MKRFWSILCQKTADIARKPKTLPARLEKQDSKLAHEDGYEPGRGEPGDVITRKYVCPAGAVGTDSFNCAFTSFTASYAGGTIRGPESVHKPPAPFS